MRNDLPIIGGLVYYLTIWNPCIELCYAQLHITILYTALHHECIAIIHPGHLPKGSVPEALQLDYDGNVKTVDSMQENIAKTYKSNG